MIILYHQTKTPISFWCRRGLNPRSFIQSSETLPVDLTRTHKKMYNLNHIIVIIFNCNHAHTREYTLVIIRDKTYFRPCIFTRFSFWSLTFFFAAFSPYPEKRVSFLSLPLHQRQKLHRWQTAKLRSLK